MFAKVDKEIHVKLESRTLVRSGIKMENIFKNIQINAGGVEDIAKYTASVFLLLLK